MEVLDGPDGFESLESCVFFSLYQSSFFSAKNLIGLMMDAPQVEAFLP
jgi:hypothetical protein